MSAEQQQGESKNTFAWSKMVNFIKFVDGLPNSKVKEALAHFLHEEVKPKAGLVDIPSAILRYLGLTESDLSPEELIKLRRYFALFIELA